MAFNPELGSTSPAVLLDNATRLDKLVNGPAADVPDRAGDPLYAWRGMMEKFDTSQQERSNNFAEFLSAKNSVFISQFNQQAQEFDAQLSSQESRYEEVLQQAGKIVL
ncbi:hypothetical protein OE279_29325, partial [Klebsiella quasipneumoniae]|nr:hypothetical protein [Klebsiella quasipneumoniae]